MENKLKLAGIILIILIIGGFVFLGLSSKTGDSCIWGLPCNEGDLLNEPLNESIGEEECEDYEYLNEGIVGIMTLPPTDFFETLEKVINRSQKDYNQQIKDISQEGSFEEIYKKYTNIFKNNYSLKIDKIGRAHV